MENKLNVNVRSFSYKSGIPADSSGNGGGFVFDCRGLLNPGRFEEYKRLTGRDKEVMDFLETKTKTLEFLNATFQLVNLTIENYTQRGFTNLEINFGCTGGQHRSVYLADKTAEHILRKFLDVSVKIEHIEQEKKAWKN